MTIQSRVHLVPISDIQHTRASRQRTDLTSVSVIELANSIAQQGLLQNIGVTTKTNEIVFGERRLTAFKLLQKAIEHPQELLNIGLSDFQATHIQTIAKKKPQYENWTKIPVRFINNADHLTSAALEFIENASREDLPWQDRAKAAFEIHQAALTESKKKKESWTEQKTADLLGISAGHFNSLISPLREMASASDKTKQKIKIALKDSSTARSALAASRTIKERHGERPTTGPVINRLAGGLFKKKEPEDRPKLACPIINGNFHEWAAAYDGPPFNFLHIDFPYGTSYNKGTGNYTSAATRQMGEYDDSEPVLWDLMGTLAKHRQKLIASSAHIMFWFSPKHRRAIQDYFHLNILSPNDIIHDWELVWHISDNSGLLPNPQREGRHTYETAFQITIGDRKIAKAKAMSFAHPRGKDKIHRSQKPLAVLEHFFAMFVDSSSHVLDPTCGSGTSIVASKKAGAERLFGIEMDKEHCEAATKYYYENIKEE